MNKKSKLYLSMAVAVLFLVLAAGLAFAFEGHPCASDMQKFCKDVNPGEGRIINCLKSHQSELSGACSSKLAEEKKEWKQKAEAKHKKCAPDVEKFCKDVKPGEGRIIECLKSHQAELSAECRETLPEHKKK